MGKQYELYVQKGQPVWKIFTNILFSHVGMFILVIGYCVGGQILQIQILRFDISPLRSLRLHVPGGGEGGAGQAG